MYLSVLRSLGIEQIKVARYAIRIAQVGEFQTHGFGFELGFLRAALLCELAMAITESRAIIRSAHIATYGERAVDVFYVADLSGAKIENPARLKALESRLLKAAAGAAGSRRKAA